MTVKRMNVFAGNCAMPYPHHGTRFRRLPRLRRVISAELACAPINFDYYSIGDRAYWCLCWSVVIVTEMGAIPAEPTVSFCVWAWLNECARRHYSWGTLVASADATIRTFLSRLAGSKDDRCLTAVVESTPQKRHSPHHAVAGYCFLSIGGTRRSAVQNGVGATPPFVRRNEPLVYIDGE